MAVLAIRDTARDIRVPGWIRQVVAACNTLCESASCHFSSVAVSGLLPRDEAGRRLLRRMVEELAERYDLEVTLDMNDTSFVANFSPATPLTATDR